MQRQVEVYSLRDTDSGIRAEICNAGASLMKLLVPLEDGRFRDVVLGFDNPEQYRENEQHLGHTVAPLVNRIGDAAFTLGGIRYPLIPNDGNNCLHGGSHVLHGRIWETLEAGGNRVSFRLVCPNGENGFPGPVEIEVTYTVQNRALVIDYRGRAQRDTLFNPTNHSYFRLSEGENDTILDHELTIFAGQITPPGPGLVPDGTLRDVGHTAFDFRTPKTIGAGLREGDALLTAARGYDHNFVLEKTEALHREAFDVHGQPVYLAARLTAPDKDLTMEVLTDRPGMQLYTANYLEETGKGGARYVPQCAVCLETQQFPNAVNVPSFPQPILHTQEEVYTRTVYCF